MLLFLNRSQPKCGGNGCAGSNIETVRCVGSNPIHCLWSHWAPATLCSATACGAQGTLTRSRYS